MGALLETETGMAFYANPDHVTYIYPSERGFGLVDLHMGDDPRTEECFVVKGNIHTVAKALGWT